jgi:integrase
MEMFLKRIMNGRTSGPLFIGVYPEVVSDVFTQVAEEVAPSKGITLKNLRQTCTDCMEKAGLEDDEIDAVLGHINVSKALIYYQDRSADAIARRLAKRTKRGVEVLSKTVEEFLQ